MGAILYHPIEDKCPDGRSQYMTIACGPALTQGQARAKPIPSPQRAERPSVPSDNSATSNVTDIHWTLSEISQELGEMSHRLAAMDNWLLALKQQSPVTESQSLGPQRPQETSELGDTPANRYPEMGSSTAEDPARSGSP